MTKSEISGHLGEWLADLEQAEKRDSTLSKYRGNVQRFIDWLPDEQEITKKMVMDYKEHLRSRLDSTKSVNTNISEVDEFLKWIGLEELCVKKIKIQISQSNEDVITLTDYKRLLRKAKERGDWQTYYIMQILAHTGIRVAELKYFKARDGCFDDDFIKVFNKGKDRRIIVPKQLKHDLNKYVKALGIKNGVIFKSSVKPGQMINASTIWRHMKDIAGAAKVNKTKVHPHSFRHLFAQLYMELPDSNLTELRDLLGHSSLETTGLYTQTSDMQKKAKLEKMQFV